MLHIYRRHGKVCKAENPQRGRSYWRCNCPIWVQGTLGGESIRTALDLTSREAASKLVNEWNANGKIGLVREEATTLRQAVSKFLDAKRNKKLAEATLYKLRNIFEKQLLTWTDANGLKYLKDVGGSHLLSWQSTWKDAPLAASKKYQRVVGFFYFCIRMKWITDNPMKAIDPPKVKQTPTLPFEPEEIDAIVSACEKFPLKGIYGEGNRTRLRAMVLLLRYSGLRIRDAATLRRERISEGKLLLYMQKTGVPVFVPLPEFVVKALQEVPNVHPSFFFWSGNGLPKTAVADWQRSLRRLFELAKITKRAHPHMMRDTFAVSLLLAGVPIDQVSILLGHSSVKITERSYSPWVKARQLQLEESVRKTWPDEKPKLKVIQGGSS